MYLLTKIKTENQTIRFWSNPSGLYGLCLKSNSHFFNIHKLMKSASNHSLEQITAAVRCCFGGMHGYVGFINMKKLPDNMVTSSFAMRRGKKTGDQKEESSFLTFTRCVSDLLACTRRLEGGVQLGRQGHHCKSDQIPCRSRLLQMTAITMASHVPFKRQLCRWHPGKRSWCRYHGGKTF